MSLPLLRDLTQINFLNITHIQHYQYHISAPGLLDPDFLAFFTIHTHDGALLYVSETTIALQHAKFGPFSLAFIPKHTSKIILSLWIKRPGSQQYNVFSELRLDLRNLIRISASLFESQNFGENTPIWSISNSYYCLGSHLRTKSASGSRNSDPHESREKLSYTVDDIRNLGNLMAGIRDFKLSKNSASAEINSLQSSINSENTRTNIQELIHKTEGLEASLAKQDTKVETCNSKIFVIRKKCKEIDSLVKQNYPLFKNLCTEQLEIVESRISPIYETLEKSTFPDLLKCIRSLVSVLETAYPIELLANTGRYCIVGLELPTSIREILAMCYSHGPTLTVQSSIETEESPISIINSGVSHITSLMSILASILNIPLKHEIATSGSRSYIIDTGVPVPVLNDKGEQERLPEPQYPLYYDEEDTQKVTCLSGTSSENEKKNIKFETGLLLLKNNLLQLSSDITGLLSQYRGEDPAKYTATVPIECQDNFLWHLHFLLLYVTAA